MVIDQCWPGRFPSGAFFVRPIAPALVAFRYQSPENDEDDYFQKDDTDELFINDDTDDDNMVTHSSLEVWAKLVKSFVAFLNPEGFRVLAEKFSQIRLWDKILICMTFWF